MNFVHIIVWKHNVYVRLRSFRIQNQIGRVLYVDTFYDAPLVSYHAVLKQVPNAYRFFFVPTQHTNEDEYFL